MAAQAATSSSRARPSAGPGPGVPHQSGVGRRVCAPPSDTARTAPAARPPQDGGGAAHQPFATAQGAMWIMLMHSTHRHGRWPRAARRHLSASAGNLLRARAALPGIVGCRGRRIGVARWMVSSGKAAALCRHARRCRSPLSSTGPAAAACRAGRRMGSRLRAAAGRSGGIRAAHAGRPSGPPGMGGPARRAAPPAAPARRGGIIPRRGPAGRAAAPRPAAPALPRAAPAAPWPALRRWHPPPAP